MRRFKLNKATYLGFLTPQDQYDEEIRPEDGGYLEANAHTIWYVDRDGKRRESITIGYAIKYWLQDGTIEELYED